MRKNIINIKKAVCTMANELHKKGYNLSSAFRKAWRRIKQGMTMRVVGVTYGKRQEDLKKLKHLRGFQIETSLERDKYNPYDKNAIKVMITIKKGNIERSGCIGYVYREVAEELSKVIDKGIEIKANLLDVIGGYNEKETYGALIYISL